MSFNKKIVGVVIAVLALFGITQAPSVGSVTRSNEYNATTTAAGWADHQFIGTADSIGTLGSIIIGTTDATIVELRDATSTTDIASTSIAVIAASPAIGSTMTFDYAIKRGLSVITTSSFANGKYTITFRP